MANTSLREMARVDVLDAINRDTPAQLLDQASDQLQRWLRSAVERGGPTGLRVKDWLHGTWLGHPLHAALTDVPIGAWSATGLFDLFGHERAADAALVVGVLAAGPTALAGAADWSDTSNPQRRVGLVHALLNTAALGCMVGSIAARRARRRALGVGLSVAGLTITSFSAWLGGELVYARGTGVSRGAFAPEVPDYRPVAKLAELEPGKLHAAQLDVEGEKVPVVLLRRGESVYALAGTCSHWGGPLAEGTVVDGDCVECPWHGSRFSLRDGSVRRGPATVPQRAYEVRIAADGQTLEVRQPSAW
jgi:nitrite reductase/ring-hydroxylating ferredoxin subunit/uncharacterized membrane protein